MLPASPLVWAETLVYIGILAAAGVFGGKEERFAAAVLGSQLLINIFSHPLGPAFVRLIEALSDAAILCALAVIAYGSRRHWALWATAFQLLAFISFIAKLIDRSVGGYAYMSLTILWGWCVIAALAVGTVSLKLNSETQTALRFRKPGRMGQGGRRATEYREGDSRFGRRPARSTRRFSGGNRP